MHHFGRTIVAGWFSFANRKATFGDVEAMHVVCTWLDSMGAPYDIAGDPSTKVPGKSLVSIDPAAYDVFIFVCGPWGPHKTTDDLLTKFSHCFKIGINLSIQAEHSHGFDAVIVRDMKDTVNPDITFALPLKQLPVVGIIQVHPQGEYKARQRHQRVGEVITEFLASNRFVPLHLDTVVENNPCKIDTVEQFEVLLRSVDFTISTRLHGMVFSLRNNVPVLAVDPIAGGAKVSAQAKGLNWPLLFDGDKVTPEELLGAADACLRGDFEIKVNEVREKALKRSAEIQAEFQDIMRSRNK